jgi:geranylgeranyl pyrophosphate synthase
MDLFTQVIDAFTHLPHVDSWAEANEVFQVAAARKPDHWLIPAWACEAVCGSQEQSVHAMLAIGCAHVAILLVDDMLDDDPRGDYHRLGMPAVSNLSCFFQGAALLAVSRSTKDSVFQLAAVNSFNAVLLGTAFGQYLDVQAPANESGYWDVAKTKSSPFFGAALQVGALAGGASLDVAEQLKGLGCLYGEMIQIHDDMHDSMETPANSDWLQGRSPLPILFASLVKHRDRARFLDLKKRAHSPDALEEAQEILIRCGAISYCVDQLIDRHRKAMELLSGLPLLNPEPVSALLDKVITPVNHLLNTVEL